MSRWLTTVALISLMVMVSITSGCLHGDSYADSGEVDTIAQWEWYYEDAPGDISEGTNDELVVIDWVEHDSGTSNYFTPTRNKEDLNWDSMTFEISVWHDEGGSVNNDSDDNLSNTTICSVDGADGCIIVQNGEDDSQWEGDESFTLMEYGVDICGGADADCSQLVVHFTSQQNLPPQCWCDPEPVS